MKKSEFVVICNKHNIDPRIALENDTVYNFLVGAREKYKDCERNTAMAALDRLFTLNF